MADYANATGVGQILLGFFPEQRVHRGLSTPAEGHPHGRKMHLPKRAGQALAGQRSHLGALAIPQRKGPQFLRLGGQVRYRLVDVESYELEKIEVVADTQHPPKGLISPVLAKKIGSKNQLPSV